MANRACTCQNFAGLTDMSIVMASKAAGPIAVTDVIRIARPVYLHGGKDIAVVNGKDGVDGLLDLSFLSFEHVRETLGVILFDKLANLITYFMLLFIVLDQSIQRKLFDPG